MSPRRARQYGHLPSLPVGSWFANRTELSASGLHTPPMQGIWGGADGAESIVVSGGYVDDVDEGDVIIYTGQGGNDPATHRQIADQEMVRGNAGLARAQLDGLPVRVTRGSGGDRQHSPASGFRYDGLYQVTDHWHETGQDGFRIWRFRLEILDGGPAPTPGAKVAVGPAGRVRTQVDRLIRDTRLALEVKRLHDYACQVCGLRLATPAGPYAEAAHIRGLGAPHNGPDELDNLLCLCPNHHVLFDTGGFTVADDFSVIGGDAPPGQHLRRHPRHPIDLDHLCYHRSVHGA